MQNSDLLISSQAKQEEFKAEANSKSFEQIKARVSSCCSFYGSHGALLKTSGEFAVEQFVM